MIRGNAVFAPGHDRPESFWTAWPGEPWIVAALLLSLALYWIGWFNLRDAGARSATPTWRALAFSSGLLALGAAIASPVAIYSEQLFFVHMIQHLLLLIIAPPLLWLGRPLVPMLLGVPPTLRRPIALAIGPGTWTRKTGNVLTSPKFAIAAYCTSVAIWHVPAFYDAAQGRTVVHDLEHLAFFVPALLYWWPVIYPSGGRRRLSIAWTFPYLVPPLVEGIIIGAIITLADGPIYKTYAELEPTWGLSALDDQQLGGLIMWVPGGMLFLIPIIGILFALKQEDARPAAPR